MAQTMMLPGFGAPEIERAPIDLGPWTKRHYQLSMAEKFFFLIDKQKRKSPLACMATGSGKTRTATMGVIRRWLAERRGPVMWMAHLNTLIRQTRNEMSKMLGEPIGLEQGERQWESERVCVASVASLHSPKRLRRVCGRPTLVIYDEAHHSVSEQNARMLSAFKGAVLLGLTATPRRKDKISMRVNFDSLCIDYPIKQGIDEGYLVPILMDVAEIPDMDFSSLTKKSFTDDNRGAIIGRDRVLNSIIEKTLERIGDRRGAMFFPTVKVAHLASDTFNKKRLGCSIAIDGTVMADDEKHARIARFKNGDYQIVCNVGVLSEGFDDPGIQFVGLCSATDAISVYLQQLGRGTRNVCKVDDYATSAERCGAIAKSSKPNLLVIDYVGNAGRHDIVTAVDALADSKLDARVVEKMKATAKAADEPLTLDELEKKAVASLKREDEAKAIAEAGTIDIKFHRVDPFAPKKEKIDVPTTAKRALDRAENDLPGFLRDHGFKPEDMAPSEMLDRKSEIIDRKNQGLCSHKQVRLLKAQGIDATGFKSGQAGALIGYMISAARGGKWMRPPQSFIDKVTQGTK
jgi:superfamily II DNA or RNA helicase